jgi:hypothetical protein
LHSLNYRGYGDRLPLFQSALPNSISPMAQFASKVDFWIPALHDHPNTRLTTWISVLDAFGDCRLYRVSHVPHITAAEDGQSIYSRCVRHRAFVRTRIVLGKTEIALRLLYDRRQRLTGLVPISSAEPNTLDGPVRVETRLRGFTLDDHARESLATVVGLLDGLCDCGLQKVARNRTSVIGRFRALPNVHMPHPKYMVNNYMGVYGYNYMAKFP